MNYIPISWEDFTPHALPKHYLYHRKGTPRRSLCQDYISLDTETSNNNNKETMPVFTELMDSLKGRSIRVPKYVRRDLVWSETRKYLTKAGVKITDSGATVSEVYENVNYLLPDAVNEADQLYYICERIAREAEAKAMREEFVPVGWVYQWCFSYPKDNESRYLVYGRKPSELTEALERVRYINGCDDNNHIILFCHNLSYDYTYIHNWLIDQYKTMGELLAVGAHRIISWTINGLEFRDSLKLSQKSLAKWGEDLGIRHKKLVGEIDYNITRYQNTPLTRSDWRYMFRDVVSLDECIQGQLDYWGDTLKTIPLTLTGYVRREGRKEFRKDKNNSKYFRSKELTGDLYRFVRSEFSGGITHGNRNHIDKTVRIEDLKRLVKSQYPDIDTSKWIIKHRDFVSHYPSQQVCNYAPGGKFNLFYDYEQSEGRHTLYVEDLQKQDRAFLAAIWISNLHIRKGVTLPYAQESKILAGRKDKLDLITDNGRVLHMLKGSSIIVVNELDLKWLVKQYTFDYKILTVYTAERTPYPAYIKDLAKRFFYDKCLYKKQEKEAKKKYGSNSPEYREAHTRLQISKAMLNAIYGMTATDPVRIAYTEEEDGTWTKEVLEDGDIEKRLSKYFNNRNNFLNYEFGCWCTAEARDQLLQFVELIGYEFFLYADTDSIFYISTPEIEARIEAENARLKSLDDTIGGYIDVDGDRYYFNQFEDEEEEIIEFRFLHAKCYAYVTSDGELHTTIAGVPEVSGDVTRVEELGSIDELRPGKTFYSCGGTMTKYPPLGVSVKPRMEVIDGHLTEVASYAIITNTHKELHSAMENNETSIFWEVEDAIL